LTNLLYNKGMEEYVEPTFIRELPSDTRVSAFHIKWKNQHYHLVIAHHGRYGVHTTCYESTNRGKPDRKKIVFSYPGDDADKGIDYLLEFLNGNIETPRIEKIY